MRRKLYLEELGIVLELNVLKLEEKIMAAIDDLRTEVAALQVNSEAVLAKIAELKAAPPTGVPEADVQAQADAAKAANAVLTAAVA